MQAIDSIETHACLTKKYLLNEKKIKCNNTIKRYEND